jgi:hypothetical protein
LQRHLQSRLHRHVNRLMRRPFARLPRLVLIGLAILLMSAPVWAQSVVQGDQCLISAESVIEGDLIVLCRTLRIDGIVRGDLLGAATTAALHGTVEGSVYLVAGRFDVHGEIGRDLHIAGASLTLYPSAAMRDPRGSVYSVSLNTTVDAMQIPGSISALGYQMRLNGTIARDARFLGAALSIGGRVGGDVSASVGGADTASARFILPLVIDADPLDPGLSVDASADIGGVLRYTAPEEARIAGTLATPPIFTRAAPQPEIMIIEDNDPARVVLAYVSQVAREMAMLAGVGALMLIFVPRATAGWVAYGRVRPARALGLGAVASAVAFPLWLLAAAGGIVLGVALTALGLAVFGASAAALIVTLSIGGASGFAFAAVFVARVIACIALGAWIARRFGRSRTASIRSNDDPRAAHLIIGALIAALAVSLPAIGWLINLAAVCAGVGAIWGVWLHRRRPAMIYDSASTVHAPPTDMPPIMDEPPALPPGMDNLPSGFTWWGDDD